MGTCCSSVKQGQVKNTSVTTDKREAKTDKQEESVNRQCESRNDDNSKECPETQEKNLQVPKICINTNKNDTSEDDKFLTRKKDGSLSSVAAQIPKSREEESEFRQEKIFDNKEIKSYQLKVTKSVHIKKEQAKSKGEQNMRICRTEVCNSEGYSRSLHREIESMDSCHSIQSLPPQSVVRDITDFMDIHTLHSSLRANDACLERMFRSADVAMETLRKSMCYAKRRQKSPLDRTSNRSLSNEYPLRGTNAGRAGIRQVKGTDDRRGGSGPGPGRVDGTKNARLPGKPRLCWQ